MRIGTIQVNNHNTEEAYVRLGSLSTEFFGGSRRGIQKRTKRMKEQDERRRRRGQNFEKIQIY